MILVIRPLEDLSHCTNIDMKKLFLKFLGVDGNPLIYVPNEHGVVNSTNLRIFLGYFGRYTKNCVMSKDIIER